MSTLHWSDLTSGAIGELDAERTVAVLPLGAIEQHGPHLPCGTDNVIAAGCLALATAKANAPIVLLPALPYGVSVEHESFPGTLSLEPGTMLDFLIDIGSSVEVAGLRKLVIINAHGGNGPTIATAALELRRLGLFVVYTSWMRLGLPAGLLDEDERETDIHGGRIETSLMLQLKPDLVDMDAAERFPSLATDVKKRYRHLRAYGSVGFGWRAEDLNRQGVVGDAAAADPEIGRAIAEHQATVFAALLDEVATADASDLIVAD